MPFNIDKLFADCQVKVQRFAREHPNETFYAFAIDADMLCLNSNERFAQSLNEYQLCWERQTRNIDSIAEMTEEDFDTEQFGLKLAEEFDGLDRNDEGAVLKVINDRRAERRSEGCKYYTDEGKNDLRRNTGDWAYQGFADMEDDSGFDSDLYDDHHYEAGDSVNGHAPHTQYAVAMTELVNRLRGSDVFDALNRSDDFTISWVDHTY